MKGILGKITKRSQTGVKREKKSQMQEKISHWCEISHSAKISHPTKFSQVVKLLDFSAFSTLLSLWFMICNDEFDSNSTCLDRLDNLGIISLQKL